METTLGKAPAIYNGHQPPRAVYPYDIDLLEQATPDPLILVLT